MTNEAKIRKLMDAVKETFTIEYCPFCENEQVIFTTGITACPDCGAPLAPCSMCEDCIDPCPYGCRGGSEDEQKKVTNPTLAPDDAAYLFKFL